MIDAYSDHDERSECNDCLCTRLYCDVDFVSLLEILNAYFFFIRCTCYWFCTSA